MFTFMLKSSRYYNIIGPKRVITMFYVILLTYLPLFESIKLMEEFNISGYYHTKEISSFMQSVIKLKIATQITNYRELRKELNTVLHSGEFDPSDSEDHMDLLMKIMIAASNAASVLSRTNIHMFDINIIYDEYITATKSNASIDEVIRKEYIPLLDLLAKAIPSLDFLSKDALENYSRVSEHHENNK